MPTTSPGPVTTAAPDRRRQRWRRHRADRADPERAMGQVAGWVRVTRAMAQRQPTRHEHHADSREIVGTAPPRPRLYCPVTQRHPCPFNTCHPCACTEHKADFCATLPGWSPRHVGVVEPRDAARSARFAPRTPSRPRCTGEGSKRVGTTLPHPNTRLAVVRGVARAARGAILGRSQVRACSSAG